MNSLRSRLILGSSLIAIVPLAIAMGLLSRRIERAVRADARLSAALGGLQVQLRTEGARLADRIEIVARDATLKRFYLLRPAGGRDLSDYLAERRFLLALDFLQVADTGGVVVADGSAGLSGLTSDEREARRVELPASRALPGPRIVSLADSSGLAMVALAPIRYENQPAGVLRGGRVLHAAFLAPLKQAGGMDLVLRDRDGRPAATTLEGAGDLSAPTGGEVGRIEVGGRSYLSRTFPLAIGGASEASITGLVSTTTADRTVAALRVTSALLGLLGLAIAVLLGLLWSWQVSSPVERLAAFSRRLAQGEWDEPLALHSVRELQTLVEALDHMRRDLVTYRDRLLVSERQAAWSQMARKVAHEVKNPLTPIAVSVADLKRSFEHQRADFPQILDQAVRTIGEEVETLKRLLQEFSDFARLPAPRVAPCDLAALLADLEALYPREVAERRLAIARADREVIVQADAGQLRQALVNLIQNALEAIQDGGRVELAATSAEGAAEISVSDTGPGLSAEQKASLFVPGFTTKAQGSGLGLTIVQRIVNDHGGTIAVESSPGRGTTFRLRLPREGRKQECPVC